MSEEWIPALEAFEKISDASGATNVSQWKREAERAHTLRTADLSVMDIYDVQQNKRTCTSPDSEERLHIESTSAHS